MDHNLNMHHNNASLHWSYGAAAVPTTPQNHWVPPPQTQSLKRAISESDCEDLYSEESSKEQYVFLKETNKNGVRTKQLEKIKTNWICLFSFDINNCIFI